MSEKTPPKNNASSEEVDLGQLFKLIGDAFNRFFNFIGRIFAGLFSLLIILLIFIKNNFWKLVIAGLIGGAIGTTIDLLTKTHYSGHLIVEPNYDSTIQLYNNIGYYNALVKDEDTLELAKTFQMSVTEAANLKGFFINPIKNEKTLRKLYSEFVEELDTASRREITYLDFTNNLSVHDYETHDIAVVSLDKTIYKKIQPVIVGSILSNPYFKNQKETYLQNLSLKDSILTNSMVVLDSLRNMYIDVRLKEASKTNESSGTTLYMASAENGLIVDESKMVAKKNEMIEEINEVKTEFQNNKEIMNIVSDFPEVGYETQALFDSMKFTFAIGALLIVLLFIAIKNLNKYLTKREKEIKL